tara:strand:+ start:798 stop:1268 length:471 start_codon:yes stop_codon:yes gene_type:complete
MKKNVFLILAFSVVVFGCSLFPEPDGLNQFHKVMLVNQSSHELNVTFSAISRIGEGDGELITRDSTFIWPVDSAFLIIDDAYWSDDYKAYIPTYYSLETMESRINSLDIFKVTGTDTTRVSIDFANKDRWVFQNSDPISYGRLYHYYFYLISDSDF